MGGFLWAVGVIGAPNGAGRPSVQELWYLSQHITRSGQGGYAGGALTLLVTLFVVFLIVVVPLRVTNTYVIPPSDDRVFTVAGWNVQQGFDMSGQPNINCVADALRSAGVDLAGLSEANTPHPVTTNNNVLLAYASLLNMYSFQAAPSSLPSVDEGILSRLPFAESSVRTLGPLFECERCPTQAHVWARSVVTWRGTKIDFHAVHVEWLAEAAEQQVRYLTEQLQQHYASGPLILVGVFNMPHNKTTRPHDTSLRELTKKTGLREALGYMEPNSKLPLPPTEHLSGLHLDYIFYRGLEVTSSKILDHVQCSDHMPVVASFRLPGTDDA